MATASEPRENSIETCENNNRTTKKQREAA